jgi:pimeloyl-ACP methyl ester carboxylesterase
MRTPARVTLLLIVASSLLVTCIVPAQQMPEQLPPVVTQRDCPVYHEGRLCGVVNVPLDYNDPNGKQLEVGFVLLTATEPTAENDGRAKLMMGGGPGDPITREDYAENMAYFQDLTPSLPLLIIDQRGIGMSTNLRCKTFGEVKVSELLYTNAQRTACAEELGSDAKHYTTINTARDIDRVRQALEVELLDVFGVSYGTFLTRTYAALFPEQVRTLTLDGSIKMRFKQSEIGIFDGAMRIATDLCERAGSCTGAQYKAALTKVVTELRANPRSLAQYAELNPTLKDASFSVVNLQNFVLTAPVSATNEQGEPTMYAENVYLILQAAQGNWQPIEQAYVSQMYDPAGFVPPSDVYNEIFYAVGCNDYETPWKASDDVATRKAKIQQYLNRFPAERFAPFTASEWFQVARQDNCLFWAPSAMSDEDNQLLDNLRWPDDLPVLFLHGDMDQNTQLENAELAALEFKQVTFVRIRTMEHVTIENECINAKWTEFINTKAVKDPGGCLNDTPMRTIIEIAL